jgi:hypothetical protein
LFEADSSESRFVCLKAVARMRNYSAEWRTRCEKGIASFRGTKPVRGAQKADPARSPQIQTMRWGLSDINRSLSFNIIIVRIIENAN